MGTEPTAAELWSARAEDWAEYQEPQFLPLYQAVFDAAGVEDGTRLLDVGCGAGLAASLAVERGAHVSGFDAAPAMIALARQRIPEADLRVGEVEDPPYASDAFDVIVSFNALLM